MKKLIAGLAFAGLSLPLLAQETLVLDTNTYLDASVITELNLSEGQVVNNYWFAVQPSTVQALTDQTITHCVLDTQATLSQGQLQLTTQALRCPTVRGDVFTSRDIEATIAASIEELCTSSSGQRCNQVTFKQGYSYLFELNQSANMVQEFNASREVNRLRMQGD